MSSPERIHYTTRFVVTYGAHREPRQLAMPFKWGIYTFGTMKEAEAHCEALQKMNSPERLKSVFGPTCIGTFRAEPWCCYADSFDPI